MSRRLRVLHIASGDLWAGAEAQAFTLITHLKRMPETDVAAVLMNEGTLAGRLRSAGIRVHVMDERKSGAVRIFSDLRAVLADWRPDVIHTHRVKENIIGSLSNRMCRNVPSIRTVHGDKEHSGAPGWRGIRRRLVHAADRWCGRALQQKVVAVTTEMAARLAREFPEQRIVVIENGVDPEAVRAQRTTAQFRAAEPDATHIGIAGRLVKVKRVDLFLETSALLLRECRPRRWRFHVFGDGPMRGELEQLSDAWHIADSVTFHGHRQDIATSVGGLDALVICSDHEGLPMISLEAVALGVPTVAHAVGGLIEVVPEPFLVARHDACGYRDGILRALREDGRAIAADRGTEILTRFSAVRNAERVRALYEHVIAERNGR